MYTLFLSILYLFSHQILFSIHYYSFQLCNTVCVLSCQSLVQSIYSPLISVCYSTHLWWCTVFWNRTWISNIYMSGKLAVWQSSRTCSRTCSTVFEHKFRTFLFFCKLIIVFKKKKLISGDRHNIGIVQSSPNGLPNWMSAY